MTPHLAIALLVPLVAACAPHVDDLRLDALRPPHVGQLVSDGSPVPLAPPVPIIVADLSTTRDLRALASSHASAAYVHVVLCRGRTHIGRQDARFDIVGTGPWRAEPAAAGQLTSASADMRFRYSVPILLRQVGGIYSGDGLGERSYADVDLRRDPVDLCLFIDTTNFGPQWRSNTVVIPADAIRAAVTAAAPP